MVKYSSIHGKYFSGYRGRLRTSVLFSHSKLLRVNWIMKYLSHFSLSLSLLSPLSLSLSFCTLFLSLSRYLRGRKHALRVFLQPALLSNGKMEVFWNISTIIYQSKTKSITSLNCGLQCPFYLERDSSKWGQFHKYELKTPALSRISPKNTQECVCVWRRKSKATDFFSHISQIWKYQSKLFFFVILLAAWQVYWGSVDFQYWRWSFWRAPTKQSLW